MIFKTFRNKKAKQNKTKQNISKHIFILEKFSRSYCRPFCLVLANAVFCVVIDYHQIFIIALVIVIAIFYVINRKTIFDINDFEEPGSLPAFRLIVETKNDEGAWLTNIDIDDCYIVDNLIYQHGADFDLFHYSPRDSKTEIRGRVVQAVK